MIRRLIVGVKARQERVILRGSSTPFVIVGDNNNVNVRNNWRRRRRRGCLLLLVLVRSSYTSERSEEERQAAERMKRAAGRREGQGERERESERDSLIRVHARFAYLFCLSNSRQKFPRRAIQFSTESCELFIASHDMSGREILAICFARNIDFATRLVRLEEARKEGYRHHHRVVRNKRRLLSETSRADNIKTRVLIRNT